MFSPRLSLGLRAVALPLAMAAASCSSDGPPPPSGPAGPVARHSSSIAVSKDGSRIYVVNADADSVSEIDAEARTLVREIPLVPSPPAVDASGHFTPAVGPRYLALSPRAKMLWVTGSRSGKLHGIDLTSGKVTVSVTVGSEPAGVVVAPDESAVYVACSNDSTVVRVDPGSGQVTTTATLDEGTSPAGAKIPAKPWALGWSPDGTALYATHILAPLVSVLDPSSLAVKSTLTIPDVGSRGDKLLANGQARGLYDVVARPGTSGELWVPHLMLAVDTVQPDLDFQSTAFPTVSVFGAGKFVTRLSTNAMDVPGDDGAFGDIVAGPRAVEFTADGRWALVLDTGSEDILAVDADGRVEAQLLRPLYTGTAAPGHLQEGFVLSPDGKHVYVDERNTSDVAFIAVDTSNGSINLSVDGPPVARIKSDPMPAAMRHGQFLFNTADSDLVPITQNHWMSCALCHVEGRTDAVTWKFLEGPRDTPSNAGGVSDTGFLLRTALRREVTDYWSIIVNEQGGFFQSLGADGSPAAPTDPTLQQDLADLQTYVNFGIPQPVPPTTDPDLVAKGKAIFDRGDVGCTTCHYGVAYTDSGAGNATLDLGGTVVLHDVGTCVTTGYPDVAYPDMDGNARPACQFDTPSLRGIAASPPYLHDGSAPTLLDVLMKTKGKMGHVENLSPDDLAALVEFLRSL